MMKKREPNKNTKKLIIIVGIVVLIVAVAVGVFMSQGKAEKSNEDIDIKEPTKIAIEQILEYGDDIVEKTFTIHMEDETKQANFADLNPEVDTMKVGKTEHELELDEDKFEVTIKVEDTQKPVINGVEETIELEGEKVDIEKELAKMITAEDPVDGELEVTFIIEEKEDKENEYNVTAEATDNNENKTTEKFEVIVKIEEKEEEAKKSNEDSKSTASKSNDSNSNSNKSNVTSSEKKSSSNKSSSSSSSSSGSSKSETKAPSKPKQEKSKQEKPKNDSDSNNSGNTGGNDAPQYPPLNNPSGLPSGANLSVKEGDNLHTYSYSRSLPGGGKITQVSAASDLVPTIVIKGQDNNGNNFMSQYIPSQNVVQHYQLGGMPKFTDDDILVLYEVGEAFGNAYKMN